MRVSLPNLIALAVCLTTAGGCTSYRAPRPPQYNNPIALPASNCDAVWDRIVDVVDDYFDVQSEQRVREAGGVYTAGRIDTVPRTGATLLEPWRGDATDRYERLHGTLQTIRRRAVVQVIPAGDLYEIEVVVYKELEDLARAEFSTAGAATFRNDSSLVRIEEPVGVQPITQGWIPLGRDTALEQEMLGKIVMQIAPRGGPMANFTPGYDLGPSMEFESNFGGEAVPPPGEVLPAPTPQ